MAYNPGPTNLGSPGNTPIFPRIVQGAEYDIANALGATDNRGVTNCAAAFAAQTEPFRVSAGTWYINTDTTISADMVFSLGAKIKVGAERTVTINGAIEAGLQQQIFDVSASGARVIGTFGNSGRSPCWWGAKGDYDRINDTGTNNYAAFTACVDACHYSAEGVSSLILVPAGNFFIEGATRAAIPSGSPINLAEAGILQMYIGDAMIGVSQAATAITFGSGCTGTGYGLVIGGIDSSGPPSLVRGIFIGGQIGGSLVITGCIGGYANGLTLQDLWVTGMTIGVLMDSTSQKFFDSVIEYCADGLRVEHGSNAIADIEINLCGNGVVCSHRADAIQPSCFTDIIIYNRNGGLPGGFGFVCTGTNTRYQITNLSVTAYSGGGAWTDGFASFDCLEGQLTNASMKITGNNYAYRISGGLRFHGANLDAYYVSGTSTTNAALRIDDGATGLARGSIVNFRSTGEFYDGIYLSSAGLGFNLSDLHLEGALRYGSNVQQATTLTVNNITAINNATAGIYDQIANGVTQYHSYTNIMCTKLGAGTQGYGVKYDVDDINSTLYITGGSNTGNTTGAYDSAGSTYTNPSTQVTFSNVRT